MTVENFMKNVSIFYSEEDGGHIAISKDFPGLSAFGVTARDALAELEIAFSMYDDVGLVHSGKISQA